MSEAYVECLIQSKPNIKAKLLRAFFILCCIACAVTMFLFPQYYMYLMLGIFAFGIGVYMSNSYVGVEYEYLYLDKEIVIDRIYNQSRRKRVATYKFSKIEVIAPIKSHHLDNYGRVSDGNYGDSSNKVVDYSIGFEAKPDLRYVIVYEGRQKILFNPNEEMIKVMKNAAPRKVFSD